MRKTLATLVFGGGLAFSGLVGCGEQKVITKKEYSNVMQENGKVVDTLYNKGIHKSDLDLQPRYDVLNDEFEIAIQTREINIPESWGVVFRCDHDNKFAIQGSEDKYKKLWERLDQGMDVVIDYRELRKNVYEDIDGDGVRDLTNSTVIDYDFIDARPVASKTE